MKFKFKKIAIIGRHNASSVAKTLRSVIDYLQKKKIKVFLERDTANIIPNCNVPILPQEKLKNICDLIVVVGGDGSLLSASQIAACQNIPIIGINRGNLGFLTDISPNNFSQIDEILLGNFHQEYRFLLEMRLEPQKHNHNKKIALNDIVLLPASMGHMIEFSVYVDQNFLCNYRSDGLIIATPTGSTAHALSSGGPILYPTIENIVLVPILSHNLSSRPIVISNKSEIQIICNKTKINNNLLILYDGQSQPLTQLSSIFIKKAKEKLSLLHPINYNYFTILRTKLHWEKEQSN
ncbi:MAG: NAD(+) kinase [Coxiellaceae bacterium]|jgi:NAD+ kinase|nr:NAD(+) kinase [Coxiellaceae bacterium]